MSPRVKISQIGEKPIPPADDKPIPPENEKQTIPATSSATSQPLTKPASTTDQVSIAGDGPNSTSASQPLPPVIDPSALTVATEKSPVVQKPPTPPVEEETLIINKRLFYEMYDSLARGYVGQYTRMAGIMNIGKMLGGKTTEEQKAEYQKCVDYLRPRK